MTMSPRILWCSLILLLSAGIAGGVLWYLRTRSVDNPAPEPLILEPTTGVPWFVDVTKQAGIDFVHFDSNTDIEHIMETMGSGVAWIDYDNDGWPDLFVVQDGPLRPTTHKGSLPTHKLYRNNKNGTFADVTGKVGLDKSSYGMGCAVGDFDNDGFDDLLVTSYKGIALYRNDGGKRFVDATADSGLVDPHWATSAAWGDIDGDGLLDLYVCNYVEADIDNYPSCFNRDIKKHFSCPPNTFESAHHKLFKNLGGGKFKDLSVESGIGKVKAAPGLAVAILDLDDDGLPDIYVANDMQPAYLFHNQGDGKFVEKAMLAGAAMQQSGRYIAGMGIAAGDFDSTGKASLFVTNFQRNPNILFLNKGKMVFEDSSQPAGLLAGGTDHLAFGTIACDADLDGHLDLAVADGHVTKYAREIFGDTFKQEARFFMGDGKARFREVTAKAGRYFHEKRLGRGLACADFNNDGKPDLVFTHNADRAALLRNDTKNDNHWLRLTLEGDGKKSNRNAIGARVEIKIGERKLVRFIEGGGSYLSASERSVLVGLGAATKADGISVRWPSGAVQIFGPLEANKGYKLREGVEKVQGWR